MRRGSWEKRVEMYWMSKRMNIWRKKVHNESVVLEVNII